MKNNISIRNKKSKKIRAKIFKAKLPRLSVHRTNKNIYVQILSERGGNVIVSASSIDNELKNRSDYIVGSGSNISGAHEVGLLIAKRAIEKGITSVAFDRAGFKYHGRVKALADSARKNGLIF